MANKQLINGKVYDWSSVTITASGMENMEPMEISYDDEQESEPIYGRGGKIRGYGTGNQKNSVKLSLLREDFNEMCRVIQSKGYKNFYKYVIPKIVVNYADEGASTCTDVLTNIVLSKRFLHSLHLTKHIIPSLFAKKQPHNPVTPIRRYQPLMLYQ